MKLANKLINFFEAGQEYSSYKESYGYKVYKEIEKVYNKYDVDQTDVGAYQFHLGMPTWAVHQSYKLFANLDRPLRDDLGVLFYATPHLFEKGEMNIAFQLWDKKDNILEFRKDISYPEYSGDLKKDLMEYKKTVDSFLKLYDPKSFDNFIKNLKKEGFKTDNGWGIEL